MSEVNGHDPHAHWYSTNEACRILKLSWRTLYRMALKPNGPEKGEREVPGRTRPEVIWNNLDIDRLAGKTGKIIVAGSPLLPTPARPDPTMQAVLGALEGLTRLIETRFPPVFRPWMTLEEASEYLGLSQKLLTRLMDAGKLRFLVDGNHRRMVAREHLDNLAKLRTLARFGQELCDLRGNLKRAASELRPTSEKRPIAGTR
jgi:excisionase family DNA binding protein